LGNDRLGDAGLDRNCLLSALRERCRFILLVGAIPEEKITTNTEKPQKDKPAENNGEE
jgi:hypothetical protein